MYETSRSLKQSQKLYECKLKHTAVSRMVDLLRQNVFSSIHPSFQAVKNHQITTYCSLQLKKEKIIHAQFLSHCATIIQINFRRYIQQKKYLQFLPIYRRFRELLQAAVLGWRIRRIMRLQPLKTQIKSIKDKIAKGQLNMSRIYKRELIDEISRLSKKGRWIQIQRQQHRVDRRRQSVNKQNVSLYGNVKSKSIKNIFEELAEITPSRKKKESVIYANQKAALKQSVKIIKINDNSTIQTNRRTQRTESIPHLEVSSNPTPTNIYDEIPIKGHHDFYALLEEKFQIPIQENMALKQRCNGKKGQKQLKKLQKNDKKPQKSNAQTRFKAEGIRSSKISEEGKQSIIDQIQLHSSNQKQQNQLEADESSTFKPKTSKCQKLKVTLTTNFQIQSRGRSEGSSRARSSRHHNIAVQQIKEDVLPKLLLTIKSNRKLSCISHLLQAYQEVYLAKKDQLTLKMKQLRRTSRRPSELIQQI